MEKAVTVMYKESTGTVTAFVGLTFNTDFHLTNMGPVNLYKVDVVTCLLSDCHLAADQEIKLNT